MNSQYSHLIAMGLWWWNTNRFSLHISFYSIFHFYFLQTQQKISMLSFCTQHMYQMAASSPGIFMTLYLIFISIIIQFKPISYMYPKCKICRFHKSPKLTNIWVHKMINCTAISYCISDVFGHSLIWLMRICKPCWLLQTGYHLTIFGKKLLNGN